MALIRVGGSTGVGTLLWLIGGGSLHRQLRTAPRGSGCWGLRSHTPRMRPGAHQCGRLRPAPVPLALEGRGHKRSDSAVWSAQELKSPYCRGGEDCLEEQMWVSAWTLDVQVRSPLPAELRWLGAWGEVAQRQLHLGSDQGAGTAPAGGEPDGFCSGPDESVTPEAQNCGLQRSTWPRK